MSHDAPPIPWPLLLVAAVIIALLLVSCGTPTPNPGTARSEAAAAQATASTASTDARKADLVAAKDEAAAVNSQEQAEAASLEARDNPTEAKIAAAATARVAALEARQQAKESRAIAAALDRQAKALAEEAHQAAARGEAERIAAEEAQALAAQVRLCRVIGGIGLGISIALGIGLALSYAPRLGAAIGTAGAAGSMAVAAFGAVLPYLGAVVVAVVALGVVSWVLATRRTAGATVALSRALDAREEDPHPEALRIAIEAKEALRDAMAKAPAALRARLESLRGDDRKWGRP